MAGNSHRNTGWKKALPEEFEAPKGHCVRAQIFSSTDELCWFYDIAVAGRTLDAVLKVIDSWRAWSKSYCNCKLQNMRNDKIWIVKKEQVPLVLVNWFYQKALRENQMITFTSNLMWYISILNAKFISNTRIILSQNILTFVCNNKSVFDSENSVKW